MGVFFTVLVLISFQPCPYNEDTKSSEVPFFSNLGPHSKANITVFVQAQGLYELKEAGWRERENPEFSNDLSKVWCIKV